MSDDPYVRNRTDATSFERRRRGEDRPSVAVLGGGVAGLSAAQEFAERGFSVTVYEAGDSFGGKARSMPGPDRGEGPPLPGEHGFRFFPGFYWHVVNTMARIPAGGGTVADRLVTTTEMFQGFAEEPSRSFPVETPQTPGEWRETLEAFLGAQNVPADEVAYFANRLLYFVTSCQQRRDGEFDEITWWDFIDADEMSEPYKRIIGHGSTQSLVAMRPRESSARTIGQIYLQLLRGQFNPSVEVDRVLDGPTSHVWIDPWVDYLDELGVDLRTDARVTQIYADGERVTGVAVDGEDRTADYYVAALPLEVMRELATDGLRRTVPSLSGLDELKTGWMTGVQIYFDKRVAGVHGHALFYDSPWALTSIAQQQFWTDYDLAEWGDGEVADILSVIISDWEEPGIVHDKPARECTPEEIRDEVWAQMKVHVGEEGPDLDADAVLDWLIDPELSFEDGDIENDSPLFINTVGSLQHRPEVTTEADNFLIASDYVRTNTDLASMESANEAARRAVNAVLASEGIRSEDCEVREFPEPSVFDPLKAQDRINYRLGLPHPGEAADPLWSAYRKVRDGVGIAGLFD